MRVVALVDVDCGDLQKPAVNLADTAIVLAVVLLATLRAGADTPGLGAEYPGGFEVTTGRFQSTGRIDDRRAVAR